MFGGVDVPGAERHCKTRQQRGHDGRQRTILGGDGHRMASLHRIEHNGERCRDRLQLQRYVGDDSKHADQRDERGHLLGLAKPGGHEIGHRRNVLPLGDARDAQDQREAKRHHQNGADIDRQEIQPARGRKSHRAKKRPRGAIDRQRQRIDQRPCARLHETATGRIAVMGDGEQPAQINQRNEYRDAAEIHVVLPRIRTLARTRPSVSGDYFHACLQIYTRSAEHEPELGGIALKLLARPQGAV